jgi:hypothetical protein
MRYINNDPFTQAGNRTRGNTEFYHERRASEAPATNSTVHSALRTAGKTRTNPAGDLPACAGITALCETQRVALKLANAPQQRLRFNDP